MAVWMATWCGFQPNGFRGKDGYRSTVYQGSLNGIHFLGGIKFSCKCKLVIFFGGAHFPCTLPETNIAPENGWFEYYFPIGEAYFQGRTVSFREGNSALLPSWERSHLRFQTNAVFGAFESMILPFCRKIPWVSLG